MHKSSPALDPLSVYGASVAALALLVGGLIAGSWLAALLLMVRKYVKKGGHGGSRGGGLAPGHWDDQGGRAAAAIAKAECKAKAAADKKTAIDRASARWKAMVGASKSAPNAHSQQPEAELRRSPRKAAAPSSSAESAAPFSVDVVSNIAAASCSSEQL